MQTGNRILIAVGTFIVIWRISVGLMQEPVAVVLGLIAGGIAHALTRARPSSRLRQDRPTKG